MISILNLSCLSQSDREKIFSYRRNKQLLLNLEKDIKSFFSKYYHDIHTEIDIFNKDVKLYHYRQYFLYSFDLNLYFELSKNLIESWFEEVKRQMNL
jgi:hypothetical protein